MTKIYDLIHLNEHIWMVEKTTIVAGDWFINQIAGMVSKMTALTFAPFHGDNIVKVLATTDIYKPIPSLPPNPTKYIFDAVEKYQAYFWDNIEEVKFKEHVPDPALFIRTYLLKQVEVDMQLRYAQQQDSDVDIEYFTPKVINNIVQVVKWIY